MYKIQWNANALKDLKSLDKPLRDRIRNAINNRLSISPDLYLIPLVGDKVGMYKFRVGEYRLLCIKDGDKLIVTVLKVKHRREVYR